MFTLTMFTVVTADKLQTFLVAPVIGYVSYSKKNKHVYGFYFGG